MNNVRLAVTGGSGCGGKTEDWAKIFLSDEIMFFCNLVPRKLGAYENYLIALGHGLRDGGDTMTAFFAADPAPAVMAALRDAGIAWRTIQRWAGEGEKVYPYVTHVLHVPRPSHASGYNHARFANG